MFLFHSNNDHTAPLHNASGKAKAFYKKKPYSHRSNAAHSKPNPILFTMTKGKQHDF